jgi:ribosomal RNA-processing protein 1
MRLHIIDIYIDELERVGALKQEEGKEVPLEMLLEPLRGLAKASPTKAIRNKAKEALGDGRLPGNVKAKN